MEPAVAPPSPTPIQTASTAVGQRAVEATALGTVVHTHSWAVLVLGGGMSATAVAILAYFGGLSESMRRTVWRRLRKVVRLV